MNREAHAADVMMGISSSSENEEDDNESLSSWDSSGSTEDQSSCLSVSFLAVIFIWNIYTCTLFTE